MNSFEIINETDQNNIEIEELKKIVEYTLKYQKFQV